MTQRVRDMKQVITRVPDRMAEFIRHQARAERRSQSEVMRQAIREYRAKVEREEQAQP